MLEVKRLEEENLIEELVCKPMEQSTKIKLTSDQIGLLFKLALAGEKDIEIPEKEKPFIYKILESRIKAQFEFTFSQSALLFLCVLIESPGIAVMFCWYTQYKTKQTGIKHWTINEICQILIPWGFFDEKELQKIWDSQKVIRPKGSSIEFSDNAVDWIKAGKSLFN